MVFQLHCSRYYTNIYLYKITTCFMFQSLLSQPKELQLTLLRHMTKGNILSANFPPGSTPLVTGAGEKLTVTTFPQQVTISSDLAVGNIIERDNVASNGVVHVIDIVL